MPSAAVQIAWGNVVFSPGNIDDADLDAILAQMRGLVARATPADAEGDLYRILDLLAHARTKAGVHYLSDRREAIKCDTAGLAAGRARGWQSTPSRGRPGGR